MLTFPEQEANVVARVRAKAATFGQDVDASGTLVGTRCDSCATEVAACFLAAPFCLRARHGHFRPVRRCLWRNSGHIMRCFCC